MEISLVVAKDKLNCIGKDNTLAWDIPEDMQWFRRHTTGKPIIMGRKTFESIGRPLPKRTNIVISRTLPRETEGLEVVRSLEEAIEVASLYTDNEVMVIGGGEIYKKALEIATKLYVTEVHIAIENGDTYFPQIDPTQFRLISSRRGECTNPSIEFRIYKKIKGWLKTPLNLVVTT